MWPPSRTALIPPARRRKPLAVIMARSFYPEPSPESCSEVADTYGGCMRSAAGTARERMEAGRRGRAAGGAREGRGPAGRGAGGPADTTWTRRLAGILAAGALAVCSTLVDAQ